MVEEIENFAKQLSEETPFSYSDSIWLVSSIFEKTKNLEKAKAIYNKDSYYALVIYEQQLRLGAVY